MTDISVQLRDYTIVLSDGLEALGAWLRQSGHSSYVLLTDENTGKHCWPLLEQELKGLPCHRIEVPAGEQHKNIATCEKIWHGLLQVHADRNALVINLGGGVIGDMGGFAASCFKRGIDFIQVPTTVLAQVDASIGGKLGVDFQYGKNLIGLFNNPRHIHISAAFHASLPDREYINGFAEVFKHALIGSPEQWQDYRKVTDLRQAGTLENLHRSLLIKKAIVEADPYEKGLRKALNFGHTLGHAVEANSIECDAEPLLHGEAMAVGMIMETFLSCGKLGLKESVLEEVIAVLQRHYAHYSLADVSENRLWDYLAMDKKNVGRRVMAALISEIGTPVTDVEITASDLKNALEFYNSLSR